MEVNAPAPITGSFVCCDCGHEVASADMAPHGNSCESVVRRRQGKPLIDRMEVHLRGLVACHGSFDDRKRLSDFLASQGRRHEVEPQTATARTRHD